MKDDLIVSIGDFKKISSLLNVAKPEIAEPLEGELNRALVVPDNELPDDVVAMNSQVSIQDIDTGKESIITLVFPHEASIEENKVSILAPVGSALIGLKVGQMINWPIPNGKEKKLKVVSVISQTK